MRDYHARGIDGIEYNTFTIPEWEEVTRKLANEIGCILTFGSDYHGDRDRRHGQLGEIHPSIQSSKEGVLLLQRNVNRFISRIFGKTTKSGQEMRMAEFA